MRRLKVFCGCEGSCLEMVGTITANISMEDCKSTWRESCFKFEPVDTHGCADLEQLPID
jgi:hypothetical protein